MEILFKYLINHPTHTEVIYIFIYQILALAGLHPQQQADIKDKEALIHFTNFYYPIVPHLLSCNPTLPEMGFRDPGRHIMFSVF